MNRKVLAALAAVTLAFAGVAATAVPASAHTPTISASCSGVKIKATSYDALKANTWSVTIGGVTESGTFGASIDKTLAVPQESATASWSATIQAEDGSYPLTKSGTVGPCGVKNVTVPNFDVAPPTCDLPGYITPNYTKWRAAQNANGYEGDGFRVYVSPAYVQGAVGTFTHTFQKVGAGFDPAYPNGTKVNGNLTQVLTTLPAIGYQTADPSAPCYNRPETPTKDNLVVVTEAAPTCDLPNVAVTTTTTVYTFTWNESTKSFDENSTTSVVVTYRDKTPAEVKDCAVIPEPIFTSSSVSVTDCETRDVTVTTTFFQSDPAWNDETLAYEFGEPYVIGTTALLHPATPAELLEADCTTIIAGTPEVQFKDSCGTTDDAVIWEDTDEFYFVQIDVDGETIVTAHAREGYEFEEGVQTEFRYTFTDEECPVVVPPTDPPVKVDPPTKYDGSGLIVTGVDNVAGIPFGTLFSGAMSALMAGLAWLMILHARRLGQIQ